MSYPANHTPSPNDGVDGLLFQIATSVGAITSENDTQEVKFAKIAEALKAAASADFATTFENTDLSGLPTSNPGGGKPWLNGGVLQVGA